MGWRHLALVYDEEALTLTTWLDHWQAHSQTLEEPLELDDAGCFVSADFDGLVDAVRLTKEALGPEQFLRATETALADVSYEHEDPIFPSDAGHLSIKRHFGAVGDGKTDDTAAIKRAFDVVDGHQASGKGSYVLFFPAGTYLVSDTVKWRRFLRVQGENRETTIIQLKDQAPGFGDPESPKPVVAASAVKGPPGSNKAVNGSTIANWFHHFTVDTGAGNPGAVGVEYHSNNYGSLEHVSIRSGDGEGVMGLDLTHKTNGPTLIAHTTIQGFTTGVKTAYMEYSVTMEDVVLSGQKEVGILNRGNILALRRITSRNAVPAIRTGRGNDMVTLLDSEFTGGAPEAAAIESDGALYARNVKIGGYGTSIAKQVVTWNPHRNPKTQVEPGRNHIGDIEEYVGDALFHPEGGDVRPLGLPIEDAPEVPIGDLTEDWVNVRRFAHLVIKEGKKEDWAPA
ncbi:MAG: glycosyl hydrolase family 28-related protein, partial [Verrucomicrobiota bacterium]